MKLTEKLDGNGHDIDTSGSGFFGRLKTKGFNVKKDGQVLLEDKARVYGERRIGAASFHKGVSAPDETFVGITYVLLFDKTTDEHGHYELIIPFNFAKGTDIEVEVCWSFDTEEAGHYVTWQIDYKLLKEGEDPTGAATTIFQQSAVTTADGDVSEDKLICTEFVSKITGAEADDLLSLKFSRDADGTNGTDDLDQDARLHAIHIHYIKNKLGKPV